MRFAWGVECKTLLGVVIKLLKTFPPIIWIFTEGEGDGIKSRLSSLIFSTLKLNFYSQVEKSTLDFEKDLIPQFLSANTNEVGLGVFVNIARSFNDIASENILSDTPMVMIGFAIVFTFVIYFLGDFSCLQNRVRSLIFLCLSKDIFRNGRITSPEFTRSWSLSCSNMAIFGQITWNYRFWPLTTISE